MIIHQYKSTKLKFDTILIGLTLVHSNGIRSAPKVVDNGDNLDFVGMCGRW